MVEGGPKAMDSIRANVRRARDRIEAAAGRAGRSAGDVLLLAAVKDRSTEEVRAVIDAGVTDLGENYVQEGERKRAAAEQAAVWHFIGHLQTNKAKAALEVFDWVQTVDRLRLARVLSRRAQAGGRLLPVLIEVNVGGEASKSGVPPEETEDLVGQVVALPGLAVRGLMCIPPYTPDPDDARPYFRVLRQLLERLRACHKGLALDHLSMGMSHDFEVAIEEGATIVRLGTVLFGPRPSPQ